jgi:hypothetical protein
MAVEDLAAENLRIHLRGSHLTLGDPQPRGFVKVLSTFPAPAIPEKQSGRLELARWLSDPRNPLTGRVIVNRAWRWHFGQGIVRSCDNFGLLGERPSHPELLDWLAARFVAPGDRGGLGWSLKALHRLILRSSVYRMSSVHREDGARADPENRLLWRFEPRRLEAEAIRDSILAASGRLDLAMGGTLLRNKNREYVTSTANRDDTDYTTPRRAVYLPVVRSSLYSFFQAFDFPDPSSSNGERSVTTIAPQALFMLNDALVSRESRALAAALLEIPSSAEGERVTLAYRRCYQRAPTGEELRAGIAFVHRMEAAWKARPNIDAREARIRAWQGLARALMAASEFVFLN